MRQGPLAFQPGKEKLPWQGQFQMELRQMERTDYRRDTPPKEEESSLTDLDNLLSQGLIDGIPPTERATQYGVELRRVRAVLIGGPHGAQ